MVNRKIILVILTLLLALSAAISSSASETLTKEDAESLIDTAAQLRMALGARLFQWFEDDADPVTVYENSSVNGKEGETQFTLYPVREGYNPDGLRALAAATLTEEYAAYVLAHYDGIFSDYREIDGKWYCIKWGIQTGYDEPVKRRDTSESIRILEETGDAARVEVNAVHFCSASEVNFHPALIRRTFVTLRDRRFYIAPAVRNTVSVIAAPGIYA